MIKRIKLHLLIILLGFILTSVFTWPFVANIDTFYQDFGEYALNGSFFAYNENAFRTGKIFSREEYFNGYQFYPQPHTMLYSDLRLVASVIFSPIFWVTNNFVLSVNLVAFLTFVFSFISAYYTINFFVKKPIASIIGAVVFAFNSITLSRHPVHMDLLNKYLLPLSFLFLYKYLQSPNFKRAFVFFAIFTLNAFSAIYFQIFALVLLPVFATPFIIKGLKEEGTKYFGILLKTGLTFLIFAPIFFYFDGAFLDFSKKEGAVRTIQANVYFSARLIDYISASPESWLYKPFVKNIDKYRAPKDENGIFNYHEHSLSLNLIPTFLFLFFCFFVFKHYKRNKRQSFKSLTFLSFAAVLILSFVLTFGPYFQGWNSNSGALKLPFYYLYEFVPFLKGIRVPARFQFAFYVPFSLFVSFGALYLFQKIKNVYLIGVLFVMILLGLFAENYMIVTYKDRPETLAKLNNKDLQFLNNKKTLHLPVYIPDLVNESRYLNWAAVTREKIMNGNTGYIPSDQWQLLSGLKDGLDENKLKILSAINVDYVIIHKDLVTEKTETESEMLLKGTVYNKDGVIVVDVSKYKPNTCDFDKDISINLSRATISGSNKETDILVLNNKSDCYLPSIYNAKYKETSYYTNDLLGNLRQVKVYYKVPVIILPFEQVVLSEVNNELRIER